nr:hypothetical protein [Heyndrickxia oleronia]
MDRVKKLISSKPIGSIAPLQGGSYGQDEAGRIYSVMPIEQLEAIRQQKQFGKDRRHFTFTNMPNIREITESLSNKYCGYILMLQPYVDFNTNILSEKGNPLDVSRLESILGVSKRTVLVVLKELTKVGVIEPTRDSYRMNERYHFRGKSGKVDVLIKTFITTLKSFNLRTSDLGFVYKLLPYVHYETNIICADPFVTDPEGVRFLNERQIGELVGMSPSKTKEVLSRLRKAGIIGEWYNGDDRREVLTVLNPYVFYREKEQAGCNVAGVICC